MQEVVQLVVGIDLSQDITQVSVMRPSAAEPEPLYSDVGKQLEFFPTALSREGNCYQISKGISTQDSESRNEFFLSDAMTDLPEGERGRELLCEYLRLILTKVKEFYEDAEISYVTVTCEEISKEKARMIFEPILLSLSMRKDQFCFLSHMEAFFHFAIRQEEPLWREGSAAFDYTANGLFFYSMECKSAGGRKILVADQKDYRESMEKPSTEEGFASWSERFRQLAGDVLKQKTYPLYITGRRFEGEWVSDVLHFLSLSRRVFRGQNLYTQGACFAASEIFRNEKNADFTILTPNQIAVDVYLQAASTEGEGEVLLAKIGQNYEEVSVVTELILDHTDKLSFRVVPLGGTAINVKMAPYELQPRADHTARYQLRMFFTRKDCFVLQLKDIGFGEFFPPSYRIYEELVDLSQRLL